MPDNGAYYPYLYTHDLVALDGGPRKASVDDLGGAAHQTDDAAPQIGVDYSATENNEQNRHIAGIERVVAICRVWVEFDGGGNPIIAAVAALGPQGDGQNINITTATFTPSHPATGQVQIVWDLGQLAPQTRRPGASANDRVGISADKLASPPSGKDGVLVETWDPTDGSGADGNFYVEIHG